MKISKIAGIIAKARHYLDLKNLMELYNTTWFIQTWPTVTSKPGFHMIATMAVIAPFAEEKNESGIAAITWKPLSSDRSDRSDNDRWGTIAEVEKVLSQRSLSLRSLRSLECGLHVIAAIADLFFSEIAAIIWKPSLNGQANIQID